MPHVEIKGLFKNYGDVRAVAGVDLSIDEGELVVLLGPSGCGKTTTLRCIAGLEEVSEGSIAIGDRVVSSPGISTPPEDREIGMVFQSYAIWPHMTVAENVAFGLKIKKQHRADIARQVTKSLDLVGLDGYADRHVSQLSGGQQQRVALARAMALEPRVLLFDEPLSNLDAKLRERMRFELRAIQRRLGITSIYVTHDQQEAMVIADRVVLMRQGKIEQIGSPVDLYQNPSTLFSANFIGLTNILPGVVRDVQGELSTVEIVGGMKIVCVSDRFRTGDEVDVVFRPETAEVSTKVVAGVNVFSGTVASSFFLGNIGDAYIQIKGHRIRVQLSPPQVWAEGRAVWLRIPPEATVLLQRSSNPQGDLAEAARS
jgi:ABC-type Fe3+/spermidine/putrescine transport system ATPase subunit